MIVHLNDLYKNKSRPKTNLMLAAFKSGDKQFRSTMISGSVYPNLYDRTRHMTGKCNNYFESV
uniref:Uncharacterized protein n=1 Tax=Tetranychus urticae TaxID=32264 RepID=T1KI90_TETUR